MGEWARNSQIRFDVGKCKIMHLCKVIQISPVERGVLRHKLQQKRECKSQIFPQQCVTIENPRLWMTV